MALQTVGIGGWSDGLIRAWLTYDDRDLDIARVRIRNDSNRSARFDLREPPASHVAQPGTDETIPVPRGRYFCTIDAEGELAWPEFQVTVPA